MSSKRRLRRRSCENKDRLTKEQAALRAHQDSKRLKTWITAYPCKFCGGWHVGHAPKKVRRAIKTRRMEKGLGCD